MSLMDPRYKGWTKANVIHAVKMLAPLLILELVIVVSFLVYHFVSY